MYYFLLRTKLMLQFQLLPETDHVREELLPLLPIFYTGDTFGLRQGNIPVTCLGILKPKQHISLPQTLITCLYSEQVPVFLPS